MHYNVQQQQDKHTAVYMQITRHQHAEQCSSHHTIWFSFQFRPDMLADIWPHPVLARFQKSESGTSLDIVDYCRS